MEAAKQAELKQMMLTGRAGKTKTAIAWKTSAINAGAQKEMELAVAEAMGGKPASDALGAFLTVPKRIPSKAHGAGRGIQCSLVLRQRIMGDVASVVGYVTPQPEHEVALPNSSRCSGLCGSARIQRSVAS